MPTQDVYETLARHLSALGMGYPVTEVLVELLRANFSPEEAGLALAIPTTPVPLEPVSVDEIAKSLPLARERVVALLEGLSRRGLLFSGPLPGGEKGYALQQVGFGFPQTFFWSGNETEQSRRMADLVARYFTKAVTEKAYSGSKTKPYRYVPVGRSLEKARQAVLPLAMMEEIVHGAGVLALAHCPCRLVYRMKGGTCNHPTEVCLKFNDMARYLIDRGLGREVTVAEAMEVVRRSEERGLVHFVDNASEGIQHNCNCCGCACWNVGNIRRRRIPRDVLMDTYFIREMKAEDCSGCGACVEICPVKALRMDGDLPAVDLQWCIGCGVCATVCPTGAARVVLRQDREAALPARDFKELHRKIQRQKRSGG
jgi:Fe-S-cluster-containing hydrogenase component 2